MTMSYPKTYVPVLRTKRGEFFAIRDLSEVARSRIMPFFDCHRQTPLEIDKGITFDRHIKKILALIDKYWPIERPFYFDILSISPDTRMENDRHPLSFCGEHFGKTKARSIFTIGPDRTQNFLSAMKDALASTHATEICVRIPKDEIGTPDVTVATVLDQLKSLELTREQAHLVLDMRYIVEAEVDELIDHVSNFAASAEIKSWKSFIVAATAFPIDMRDIQSDEVTRLKRVELKLWKALVKAEPLIGRKPTYADYGIINPEKPEVDVRVMRGSCKIRYTTDSEWIVVKGHSERKTLGRVQYPVLTSKLVKETGYLGKEYSWGDNYIHECASTGSPTGNGETWVRVDTNHHLTLVGETISSLSLT